MVTDESKSLVYEDLVLASLVFRKALIHGNKVINSLPPVTCFLLSHDEAAAFVQAKPPSQHVQPADAEGGK